MGRAARIHQGRNLGDGADDGRVNRDSEPRALSTSTKPRIHPVKRRFRRRKSYQSGHVWMPSLTEEKKGSGTTRPLALRESRSPLLPRLLSRGLVLRDGPEDHAPPV